MAVREKGFYGWKLLLALSFIVATNLAFPLYGGGLIATYMAADLHFDRGTLGVAFGLFQWMIGLPGPLVALSVNKKGVRFTLALGTSLVVVGALTMALFVYNRFQLYIVFGIIIASGAITGGAIAAQTALGRWFEKRKALAISMMPVAGALGGFVAPLVLNRVIMLSGRNWRAGWWLICGLSFLATLVALVFVKEQPSDLGQLPDGESATAPLNTRLGPDSEVGRKVYKTTKEWSVPATLRSSSFWVMFAAALGFNSTFSTVLSHGSIHLIRDLGHTPAEAAFSLSVLSIAGLIGTLTVGVLGDRFESRYIWLAGSLASGLGILVLLNASSATDLYLYSALVGFGYGTCMTCVMTLPAIYFGHRAYAAVIGLLCAAGTTVGALATYGAGYSYDHFGSYAHVFYLIAILGFGGSVLALFMKPPTRRGVPTLVAATGSQTD
jgi:MFS family permease